MRLPDGAVALERGRTEVGRLLNPIKGALVFWRTSNPAGHVALSLGNGVVVSTDYNA